MIEHRINCPWNLGERTRDECKLCQYCNLGDCPVGAHFVNKPEQKEMYAAWLTPESKLKLGPSRNIFLKWSREGDEREIAETYEVGDIKVFKGVTWTLTEIIELKPTRAQEEVSE